MRTKPQNEPSTASFQPINSLHPSDTVPNPICQNYAEPHSRAHDISQHLHNVSTTSREPFLRLKEPLGLPQLHWRLFLMASWGYIIFFPFFLLIFFLLASLIWPLPFSSHSFSRSMLSARQHRVPTDKKRFSDNSLTHTRIHTHKPLSYMQTFSKRRCLHNKTFSFRSSYCWRNFWKDLLSIL